MKDYAKALLKSVQDRIRKDNLAKIRASMPEQYWKQLSVVWDIAFLYGSSSPEFKAEIKKLNACKKDEAS